MLSSLFEILFRTETNLENKMRNPIVLVTGMDENVLVAFRHFISFNFEAMVANKLGPSLTLMGAYQEAGAVLQMLGLDALCYYDQYRANPELLQRLIDDPSTYGTTHVFLDPGLPDDDEGRARASQFAEAARYRQCNFFVVMLQRKKEGIFKELGRDGPPLPNMYVFDPQSDGAVVHAVEWQCPGFITNKQLKILKAHLEVIFSKIKARALDEKLYRKAQRNQLLPSDGSTVQVATVLSEVSTWTMEDIWRV